MCIQWLVPIYQWLGKYCFYIYPESWSFSFITVQSYVYANDRLSYAWWSYSLVCTLHYLIIIITQKYLKVLYFKNACQVHSVECVSRIRTGLSIIFHAIYGALCIQLTHFFCDDCENTCALSYYRHQIGSMALLPLFRVRSWNHSMPDAYMCVLTTGGFAFIMWSDSCPLLPWWTWRNGKTRWALSFVPDTRFLFSWFALLS